MVAARAPEVDARTEILSAATRLFASRGFGATAVQDVADAVGVTKAAVLHHFRSKEELRKAVLGAILAHWNDTLPRLLLAATASHDRFEAVFGELHRFFSADASRALVVLREAIDRPVETRRLLRGPVKPWLAAVARYIRAGQEGGRHHRDVDAEAYVVHVLELVVVAAAAAPLMSAVLEDEPRARYDRELARIARASLFSNDGKPARHPTTDGRPSRPPRHRPKTRR